MESKLLYTVGNIGRLGLDESGYPYGVEAEEQFGSIEVHGPFISEHEAQIYADELVGKDGRYDRFNQYLSAKVVKIETPQAGPRIFWNRDSNHYEYAV